MEILKLASQGIFELGRGRILNSKICARVNFKIVPLVEHLT